MDNMATKLVLALLALVSTTDVVSADVSVPPVVIDVRSMWKSTPTEAEASELLAAESSHLFWKLADVFELGSKSVTELKKDLGVFADNSLPSLASDIFKAELEARAATAAVEAILQISRSRADVLLSSDSAPECQKVFYEANGQSGCSATNLPAFIDSATKGSATLSIDHLYPGSAPSDAPTIILYGAVGSSEFKQCHDLLKTAAEAGKVQYAFRHYYTNLSEERIKLPGYGVELDVKKMDYKAVDDSKVKTDDSDSIDDEEKPLDGFDFKKLKERFPEKAEQLSDLKGYLVSMRASIREMKVWELQDIDIQAATRIMRSSDPIDTLQHVSQDFPILASSIISEKMDDVMLAEIRTNQEKLAPVGLEAGSTLFTVNSRMLDPITTDIFSLLQLLKSDAKLLGGLDNIGFPADVISKITSLSDESNSNPEVVLDTRSKHVQFVNNLESDKMYKRWPTNMMDLLRPAWPGQPRKIGRNIFTAVAIINPTTTAGLELFLAARELIKMEVPIRFGFLFTSGTFHNSVSQTYEFTKEGIVSGSSSSSSGSTDEDSNKACIALMRAFAYLVKEESLSDAFAFLESIAKWSIRENTPITTKRVKSQLVKLIGEEGETIIKKTKYSKLLKKSERAIRELGLDLSSKEPQMFLNGQQIPIGNEVVVEELALSLQDYMDEGLQPIQRALYFGHITAQESVYDHLLDKRDVVKRINPLVTNLNGTLLDLTNKGQLPKEAASMSSQALAGSVLHDIQYVEQLPTTAKAITFWIVADFDTQVGQHVAFEALRRQLWDKKSRIGFIHNGAKESNVARLLYAVVTELNGGKGIQAAGTLLAAALNGETSSDALLADLTATQKSSIVEASKKKQVDEKLALHLEFSARRLRLSPGESIVVMNGRVIGPLSESSTLEVADFKILEKKLVWGSAGKLLKIMNSNKILANATSSYQSDMILRTHALISMKPETDGEQALSQARRIDETMLTGLATESSGIKLTGKGSTDAIKHKILAILDPLAKETQHLVPVLRYLADITAVDIQILLNPKEKVSEKPLNRFYRTVLPDPEGKKEPAAIFKDMPTAPLLTVGMHVPPAWLVQAEKSPYDLDNIHLQSAPKGVFAEFALEYLMLEGRAHEEDMSPAAGLQLELGAEMNGPKFDTIVMANLGYFQLKATPGAWQLQIREGRSSKIFKFAEVVGSEASSDIHTPTVIINKLTGKHIAVQVERNPGQEQAKLLTNEKDGNSGAEPLDDEDDASLWGSLKTLVGGKTVESADVANDVEARSGETINIFSLASGHLYERFMKLMMLSVLKNTNNPVKFWFLKNCMSPQMQEFLPYMAAEYGFEYELVQYKWPSWLNLPPTRHRQIWGYKILFLDVLFPLDLKKFIFVDADQVVRADMKELVEFDLEGAPYGYTPFCNDKKEMDGFRFWKSGYWKNHLSGRPYHISALYVVDLLRFRKLAAGDRLREQYQGLSRDPNSLANLDQDLPNNMVHQVPIKSLPQEWLWCETWCSNEIKPKAKTIDLCNNPLTKEPKLEAAVRIVAEWRDLDYEAKNMTARAEAMIDSGVPPVVRRDDLSTHEEL